MREHQESKETGSESKKERWKESTPNTGKHGPTQLFFFSNTHGFRHRLEQDFNKWTASDVCKNGQGVTMMCYNLIHTTQNSH